MDILISYGFCEKLEEGIATKQSHQHSLAQARHRCANGDAFLTVDFAVVAKHHQAP